MVSFAVQTVSDERVSAWLTRVGSRLNDPSWVGRPFSGGVKDCGSGLFVLEVTPLYSRFVMNTMQLFLLVGLLVLGYAGWTTAFHLYWAVGFSFIVTNLFWTASFYQAVLWLQVRKITGSWHKVRRADQDVLGRVLHGTV